MSQNLILVIGGAASGKSSFAEKIVKDRNLSQHYIATARVWDGEMSDKVAAHKIARGAGWTTHEAPLAPEERLMTLSANDAVLLDCATMWLTNHLMDETDYDVAKSVLLNSLIECPAYKVVVTNEVGGGIVPADALSRRFRQLQGMLNQELAAQAHTVVHVVAGLPNVLKGTL